MTVRLGIKPITWTNDDMRELAGDIPLETCLAAARLAGYSWMEMGASFRAMRPCCARFSIAITWLPASQEWRNVLHRR